MATSQYELNIALLMLLLIFLPAVFLAKWVSFSALTIFVWTCLLTQAVSIAKFYIYPEFYFFQEHRKYNFGALEGIEIQLRLAVFVILTSLISLFFKNAFNLIKNKNFKPAPTKFHKNVFEANQVDKFPRTEIFIFLIIFIMVPIHFQTFKNGIAITGIQPPALPFKISGVLYYFSKWLIPALLAYLVIKMGKLSISLMLVFSLYSLMLGVATSSRSASLSIVITPLILAILNRSYRSTLYWLIIITVNLHIVTMSREIVFQSTNGNTVAYTALGVVGTLIETVNNIDLSEILLVIPNIFARISSFEGSVLGTGVDASALGGSLNIFLQTVHWPLVDLSHEAVHLQVLGYVPPYGFYNATADLFSYVIWATNQNIGWILIFSLYTGALIYLLEKSLNSISIKFTRWKNHISLLRFFLVVLYVSGPGSPLLNSIFIIIILSGVFLNFLFGGPKTSIKAT